MNWKILDLQKWLYQKKVTTSFMFYYCYLTTLLYFKVFFCEPMFILILKILQHHSIALLFFSGAALYTYVEIRLLMYFLTCSLSNYFFFKIQIYIHTLFTIDQLKCITKEKFSYGKNSAFSCKIFWWFIENHIKTISLSVYEVTTMAQQKKFSNTLFLLLARHLIT